MLLQDVLRKSKLNPAVREVLENLRQDPDWGHNVDPASDLEPTPGYPNVLRLKSNAGGHNGAKEVTFAARISQSPLDWVVLLGSAPAIDGFFLSSGTPFQLKQLTVLDPQKQPRLVVENVNEAWKSAAKRPVKWRNITVYVEATGAPADWIYRRWTEPTDPRPESAMLIGDTIRRVVVYAAGGNMVELPKILPQQKR